VLADYAVMDLAAGGPRRTLFSSINAILDHNLLLNYVANQHIDHSTVSISGATGISGGGNITASRTLSLDINGLTADTLATGDFFVFYDISGGDHNKITFANLTGSIDHNSLLNYVADQHVAHSGVTLTAGSGLTGGGTIAASRTFDVGAGVGIRVNTDDVAMAIDLLTADTLATGDFIPFYDISGSDHNKVTVANLNSFLDHNSLTNYVANQHIDHTTVSISTTEGIQGGGTIAATRTLKLDINGLTADASPDSAADYVTTWDASAGVHKKVLLSNLPGGLNITGLSSATPATGDEIPIYDISAAGNRKTTLQGAINIFAGHFPAEAGSGSAAAGEVGQSNLATGAPSLTSATAANVCSISVPAGDFEIMGIVQFAGAGATTTTSVSAIISATSTPSVSNANSIMGLGCTDRFASTADVIKTLVIMPYRVSNASPTTYYLHASATFAVSTFSANGILRYRCAR
jgi:hypothetical protein